MNSEIQSIIRERQSLRVPFDAGRPLEPEHLQQILEAARWAPTAHNMQNFFIVVVDDKSTIHDLFSIPRPVSETFIRENYAQLSFSPEELTQKKTGLLGTMFPPSWRKPGFRLADLSKEEQEAMQRPLPPCPVLLVVVYDPSRRAPASDGDFLGIVSLGCVMQNMWLTAHSLGIGFHILSSFSSGHAANAVKKLLCIPPGLQIAFTFRLGYPLVEPPEYLRVRRDTLDFVHKNRW